MHRFGMTGVWYLAIGFYLAGKLRPMRFKMYPKILISSFTALSVRVLLRVS